VKNTAVVLLGAVGAIAAINAISKPTRTQGIAGRVRKQMDEYNATVHPDQDPMDTIFDRTNLMNDEKKRKPWNQTTAERERISKA